MTLRSDTEPCLVDTHCHLDFACFDADRSDVLENAQRAGVKAMIVPGVVQSEWGSLWALCGQYDILHPAVGLHPCFMAQHPASIEEDLNQFVANHKVVAIGEIGLDLFERKDNLDAQLALLKQQLRVAKAYALPVIMHVRRAHDEVQKCLRELDFKQGGTIHAYSGSLQQAKKYLDRGFKLGIGGGATYDRAQRLHKILRTLPLSAFVLETDAPDIPPSFARGQRNSPEHLPKIAALAAQFSQLDYAKFCQQTTANAIGLFDIELA